MSGIVKWLTNNLPKDDKAKRQDIIKFLSKAELTKVREFHQSFPQYDETPLVALNNLAKEIGVGNIFIKDESFRFGLNAFKVLGGSFAMAKYLAQKLGKDISQLTYGELIKDEVRQKLGEITFVTATDGNHGRGVAWTANKLKQKSLVYMPAGSSRVRLENIRAEGADASIKDMNYDECVRLASKYAREHNGVVVQDTAWEGYDEIPAWIMQGYGTMALEALETLREKGIMRPTHIFLQAGVGSFAGAIQGFFAAVYGKDCPVTVIVESDMADCHYQSALAGDGKPRAVGGDLRTIMAGLACGEVNSTSWEIIKNYSDAFVACPDYIAANGMRILSSPLPGDVRVVSGESGAVTTGLLYEIMINDAYREFRDILRLDRSSTVLLFSTEGDTDPSMYRKIVWHGQNEKE